MFKSIQDDLIVVPLDIYGTLVARPQRGAIAVTLETRYRWGRDSRFVGPQRSATSEVDVKPEEIVELRLPTLGAEAGPFAKRELSIRVRARQLR